MFQLIVTYCSIIADICESESATAAVIVAVLNKYESLCACITARRHRAAALPWMEVMCELMTSLKVLVR